MVLTPLWEVTSGTRAPGQRCVVQASHRLSRGDGREGNLGVFPKSPLEPKGLVGHSCAESVIIRGLNYSCNRPNVLCCVLSATWELFNPAFLRACYRGTAGARAGKRRWSSSSEEWALQPGSSCKSNQFSSLCLAERSSILPASGVKQHVLNDLVSIAPLGTSCLFPASPEETGRP